MAVNDVWKINVYCSFGQQAAINVGYWQVIQQVATMPSASAVAGFFSSTFAPLYKNLLAATANFHGVSAQHWRPAPPRIGFNAVGNQGPGLVAGEVLPTQVCGLISFRTQLATRRGRGRWYIPFPSETHSTAAGNPATAYTSALTALADVLDNDLAQIGGGTDVTWRHVIFGRATFSQEGIPLLDEQTVEVTSALPSSLWATQRRRAARGRINIVPPIGLLTDVPGLLPTEVTGEDGEKGSGRAS